MGKSQSRRTRTAIAAGLAALAILAYWPSLSLPYISDDYVQIMLARDYGPVSGWPSLAQDALYRCRATSLVLTYWTEKLFGLDPLPYRLSSLLLHILNTWLVYALGAWRVIGRRVALPAAAFFAVYEGHQEAVIWYAALPELLVFFFSLLCLTVWIRWLERRRDRRWYLAALAAFLLALASKESGVAVVGLLALIAWSARKDRAKAMAWIAPFGALSVAYAALIFAAQNTHLHLNDGTFSLRAAFWWTLLNSTRRLFWFWGLLALVVIIVWRLRRRRFLLCAAAAWIVITFLPYSFLTYMPHVPSRHTYFASAGLAFIVGAGGLAAWRQLQKWKRWAPAALAGLIIAHNCLYLWIRKQRQFAERAAPTEALVEFAAKTQRPIVIECFPYSPVLAQMALELRLKRKAYPAGSPNVPPEAAGFCWPHQPGRR